MKTILLVVFILHVFTGIVKAQTINITSFQHTLRWLDEGSFPPYVTNENVNAALMNAAASGLSYHFNATVNTKTTAIVYKNISMFGKPVIKAPARSSDTDDLQVSLFSFITRATTGLDVYWNMEVRIEKNDKTFYSRETKHQLKNYNEFNPWFSEDEFIELFVALLDELFENKEPIAKIITLGTRLQDKDSLLLANSDKWKVDKNKVLFGFGKPSFGYFTTLNAGKTDSATLIKKSKEGAETSVLVSNGKVWMGQTKIVNLATTKFCSLVLSRGEKDTAEAFFSIFTNSSTQKQTALGFILSGSNQGQNNSSYYCDRNVNGVIRSGDDSIQWIFSISHYSTGGYIESGYLLNGQDSLILFIGGSGYNTTIIVSDKEGAYLAALERGLSKTEVLIRKDISPSYQNAIATLFAVLISIKNLPE